MLSLLCRVFTTHEQLAVSEEREAELAAAMQEAKQSAAAARQALAANQQAVNPQPSPVQQDEQVSLSTWAQSCCICRSAHPCTHIHSIWYLPKRVCASLCACVCMHVCVTVCARVCVRLCACTQKPETSYVA